MINVIKRVGRGKIIFKVNWYVYSHLFTNTVCFSAATLLPVSTEIISTSQGNAV